MSQTGLEAELGRIIALGSRCITIETWVIRLFRCLAQLSFPSTLNLRKGSARHGASCVMIGVLLTLHVQFRYMLAYRADRRWACLVHRPTKPAFTPRT